jgi:hypothetical protein
MILKVCNLNREAAVQRSTFAPAISALARKVPVLEQDLHVFTRIDRHEEIQ